MIDVAIIIGSTRPGRKGEAVAGNHLGNLPSDPMNRAQKTTPSCPAAGPHRPTYDSRFDLLTTSEGTGKEWRPQVPRQVGRPAGAPGFRL